MKIAVSGKGGVGKTTIAATLARILLEKSFKVLAIDADPNSNLALALGMSPAQAEAIVPLSENSTLIEEKTGAKPDQSSVMFRLSFRVDDIIDRFAVKTPSGINLIVMGVVRASGQGCMCPANALIRAFLRYLLTKRDEAVMVDLEAGVEHFGRGTAEHVDLMVIVTEPTLKSFETVKRIYMLSKELKIQRIVVLGNRVLDHADEARIDEFCKSNGIPVLGFIPYDEEVRMSDARGAMLNLKSRAALALHQLSEKLLNMAEMAT